MALKQAIQRGTVLHCVDVPTVKGKNYMVVNWDENGYLLLADMDAVAEHAADLSHLGLQDFWKVSNKYLQAHFEIAEP